MMAIAAMTGLRFELSRAPVKVDADVACSGSDLVTAMVGFSGQRTANHCPAEFNQ